MSTLRKLFSILVIALFLLHITLPFHTVSAAAEENTTAEKAATVSEEPVVGASGSRNKDYQE